MNPVWTIITAFAGAFLVLLLPVRQPESTESGEIEFPQPTGEDPDRVD